MKTIGSFFLLAFIYSFVANGQSQVIRLHWTETLGVQSGPYGLPTTVDGDNYFYCAGSEIDTLGNKNALVQMYNPDGGLLWTTMLNTPDGNFYEPARIEVADDKVYVLGVVLNSTTMFNNIFVCELENNNGTLNWFHIDTNYANDYPGDFVVDYNNSNIYVTGATDRFGNEDMLVFSISTSGTMQWTETYDYLGLIDAGVRIFLDGSDLIINGSSQSTNIDWDIVSWQYDISGNYISDSRSSGISAPSDEVKDAVVLPGMVVAVGRSFNLGQSDIRIVCYDSNNNHLWDDTYDHSGGNDVGLKVISDGTFIYLCGYVTNSNGDQDIFVRKYDDSGNDVWTFDLDYGHGYDRAVDLIMDNEGNIFVLVDVELDGKFDVLLISLDASSGVELWTDNIAIQSLIDEEAISIESSIQGNIYITYLSDGTSRTKHYEYTPVEFPPLTSDLSKGSHYISNRGQLLDDQGGGASEVIYYSFGQFPDVYLRDEGLSYVVMVSNEDSLANDTIQRVDINFFNPNHAYVGHLGDYTKEMKYNFYFNEFSEEQIESHGVLSYLGLYDNINAFIFSNSSGFKMSFMLDSGANVSDIVMDVSGALDTSVVGTKFIMSTFLTDIVWQPPVSYTLLNEFDNDHCIRYEIIDGYLHLSTECDLSFPYVIEISMGPGDNYSMSAINNMDWSTFYGGNFQDVAHDIVVDDEGSIYVCGFTTSGVFPLNAGIDPNALDPYIFQGIIVKFSHEAEVKWGTIIRGQFDSLNELFIVKALGLYDNDITLGNELHLAGEYRGSFEPYKIPAVPVSSYQQVNGSGNGTTLNQVNLELFLASLNATSGALLYKSPYGGATNERVHDLDISSNGLMYFVGSTEGSGSSTGSQGPPSAHTFPVYDPSDGSYYEYSHPSPGNQRGYISVLNLESYELEYSSLIAQSGSSPQSYQTIYDIDINYSFVVCGKGTSYAKYTDWDGTSFGPAGITDNNHSDYDDILYFNSIVSPNYDIGMVVYGKKANNHESIGTNNPAYSFQASTGEAFYARITEGSFLWKSHFGLGSTQWWDGPFYMDAQTTSEHIDGRGHLAYSSDLNTVFSLGTTHGAVQSEVLSGYFNQSQPTVGSNPYDREELYLNAFCYASPSNSNITDYLQWSTHYGSNEASGTFGHELGEETASGLVVYTLNQETYVVTLGSSTGYAGSLTGNINLYPVSDLGYPNSWFRQNNNAISWRDFVITRFKVGDLQQSLPITIQENNQHSFTIFPNPTVGQVKVLLDKEQIHSVSVYNMLGNRLYELQLEGLKPYVTLDLSQLKSGIYIIEINNSYYEKVVKY